MKSPLLRLSIAFFAGVAVATGFTSTTVEIAALATLTVAATLYALTHGRRSAITALLFAALFALGLAHAVEGPSNLGSVADIAAGRRAELTGVVVSTPQRSGATQELRLATESLAVGGERVSVDGQVLVRAPLGPDYRYGDRLRGFTTLRPTLSLDGSPLVIYQAERGIAATGFIDTVERLDRNAGNPLRGALAESRADLDRAIGKALDEPLAGLAQGIVTGRRDSLSESLQEDLRATGLTHLVVISGSNVTILAGLVVAASAWVIGRRRALWLALAVVGLYTAFVGADAPVVRAAIMASLYLGAGLAGRRGSAAPAIAFAAALMVLVTPSVIDDLSFQLSFVATASLALLAGPALDRLAGPGGLDRSDRSPGSMLAWTVAETAVVSVAAIAATLPLIALHFGRISLIALPANLLVVPTFSAVFVGNFATAVLTNIDTGLGTAAAWLLAWLPLTWFVEVSDHLADLPFASASVDGFGLTHAVLLYTSLLGIALWLRAPHQPSKSQEPPRSRSWLNAPMAFAALGVFAALNVAIWSAVATNDSNTLDIYALDVGQGDATLVVTPSGATALVDGGPDGRRLLSELSATLPLGRRTIDLVVATHPQADHLSGLFDVLDRYRVDVLLVSPINARTELGRQLARVALARGVALVVAEPETLIMLDATVALDVLGPLATSIADDSADVNSGSIALRLRHDAVSLLLTGDMEALQEVTLARQPWDLRATVLKVSHHGSATSTTDLLLRRVQPHIALISAAAGNRFGHPHDEVLQRLMGTIVLRTDLNGTIHLRSDGASVTYDTGR
jgi:competence protein ComEC